MKRLWLLFAQTVTVLVAALFVVATLQPQWLGRSASVASVVPVLEAPSLGTAPAAVDGVSSFRSAARAASPAVVSINTSKAAVSGAQNADPWFRFFFGDQAQSQPQTGLGSGVIVSPAGYVLTNNHVIEEADEIEVILNDGRKSAAKVIGTGLIGGALAFDGNAELALPSPPPLAPDSNAAVPGTASSAAPSAGGRRRGVGRRGYRGQNRSDCRAEWGGGAGVGAVEEQVGTDDHDGDGHGVEGGGFRREDDAQGHAGRVAGGESEDRRIAISETKLGFYFGSRRRRLPVTGRSRTRARTAFCAAELTEAKA
eukprot:gene15329-32470_t